MNRFFATFLAFSVFLLAAAPVFADTTLADFTGNGYNLTCTNSPVYNYSTKSYDFGPAGNQKCDPVTNFTTAAFPSNSTPYTVVAYIKLAGNTPTGQSMHLINNNFNFAENKGTSFRFEANSTAGMRLQTVEGGTFKTGSYLSNYTATGRWVAVMYNYNGSGIIAWVDNSVSINTTSTGAGISGVTSPNNQLFGSGTAGGYANGMFNGTVKNLRVYNRSLSNAERIAFMNNQTISNSGLVASWGFDNITSNATTTAIRNVSSQWRVFETNVLGSPWWMDDGSGSYAVGIRNTTLDRLVATNLRFQGSRWDMNMELATNWDNTTKILTCNYNTGAGQIFRNCNALESNINFSIQSGGQVWLTAEQPPTAMRVENATCPTTSSCAPYSWTAWGGAVAQFLDIVAPAGRHPAGSIVVSCENEPYNSQFYWSNATAAARTSSIVAGCQEFTAELRRLRPDVLVASPSFTTSAVCCSDGQSMAIAYMGNVSGTANEPDYLDFHIYDYTALSTVSQYYGKFAGAYDLVMQYAPGMIDKLVSTETNWEHTGGSRPWNGSMDSFGAIVGSAQLKAAVQLGWGVQALWPTTAATFNADTDDSIAYSIKLDNSTINTYGSYIALNITAPSTYGMGGTITAINLTSDNSNVNYFLLKKNDSESRLAVINAANASYQPVIDLGAGVISVKDYYTNASEVLLGTSAVIDLEEAYGWNWYTVTYAYSPTNISYAVTVPGNPLSVDDGTIQSFSVVISNPSNLSVIYEWLVNGTNQTLAWNSSAPSFSFNSVGVFNLTNVVYSGANNLTYSWIVTVSEVTVPTVCEHAQTGVAGFGMLTDMLGNMVLVVVLSLVITIVGSFWLGKGFPDMQVLLMVGAGSAVAVIVITFIVAFGSAFALAAAGCA